MSPRLALGREAFELHDGDVLVGNGAQATWRVQKRDLLARHFIVRLDYGVATVYPASDAAVVAVDGDQVSQAGRELTDGNRILAGDACFYFWTGAPRAESAEQPPTPPAHLIAEQSGIVYPLTRNSTAIGRDPSNFVVVHDPTASRFHAEIRREAGGYALHSMGSTGTRVNGEELHAPRLLREDDVVEIAFARLHFTWQPVPTGVPISAEAVAAGAADVPVTGPRARVSLSDVGPTREPPRNVALLVGTTAVLAVMVAALFWLLR